MSVTSAVIVIRATVLLPFAAIWLTMASFGAQPVERNPPPSE
jgi:hypothetical protein